MARICNDEWVCFGVMSGHDRKTLSLSVQRDLAAHGARAVGAGTQRNNSATGATLVTIASSNHLLLQSEPGWARAQEAIEQFLPTAGAAALSGPLAALTPRLRELLELLALGRDNTQIAAVMGLSEKTVRNQVSMLFDRLGVESRAMAIVLARDNGVGQLRQ